MKVAVIGSGGREHAIIKSISLNPKVEVIYAISGMILLTIAYFGSRLIV